MAMGIGINTGKPDEGELKRKQEEIACGVWFTSTGAVLPKMIKYKDESGVIQTIQQIQIRKQKKKYYCGIPAIEYCCSTVYNNREYIFRLYYYIETNCWKLSWEG